MFLSKEIFTAELNMNFPSQTWVEKTVHGIKRRWLSDKKVFGEVVSKESHADSLWWNKRTMNIDFFENVATVNSTNINFIYWRNPYNYLKFLVFNVAKNGLQDFLGIYKSILGCHCIEIRS